MEDSKIEQSEHVTLARINAHTDTLAAASVAARGGHRQWAADASGLSAQAAQMLLKVQRRAQARFGVGASTGAGGGSAKAGSSAQVLNSSDDVLAKYAKMQRVEAEAKRSQAISRCACGRRRVRLRQARTRLWRRQIGRRMWRGEMPK